MDHLLHRKEKHKAAKASAASFEKQHHHHTAHSHHSAGKHGHAPYHLGLQSRDSADLSATPASLDIVIESPPCVLYGTSLHSTGALLSGRLRVKVPEPASSSYTDESATTTPAAITASATTDAPPGTALTLATLKLRLVYTATTKKPVAKDCPDCCIRTEELGRWEFLTEPIHLKPGSHDFPFSYLLPGHLPASTMGSLGTVEYSLRAGASTLAGEDLPPLLMPLRISRAVLPGNDKTSVRIFPPTNLAGKIILPSVVHPIGTFPVQMCLSGVVDTQEHTQTRWRLRKVIWRIEEHQKLVSTACPRHAHKLTGDAVTTGGPAYHETRIVGHGEEKTGWKTDFDTAGGEINFEFIASLRPGCEPLCDIFPLMKSDGVTPLNPGALEVRHNLVIELIVAEEFATLAPGGGVKSSTPTGAARVLRMLFHLNVTERSGLGISWDEEMPPVYADVPPSPPTYAIEPELEEKIGLTGPGVPIVGTTSTHRAGGQPASSSSSAAGAAGGPPPHAKLPHYSRLEQMDSCLTPVQRPRDTHPALQHRVPLALPLAEVAALSLDNPTPRHSFSQGPRPSLSSHSNSHSHIPPSRSSNSTIASTPSAGSSSYAVPPTTASTAASTAAAATALASAAASDKTAVFSAPIPAHHLALCLE
ncbi:hypothetical protein KEM52_001555 [Ascosphaera acerosa]|nr:hypothetical protein KEM52_001555 [Ascosphaera acerosa]